MAQSFDAQYRQAAQSAGRKIAGVLPEKLRDEVGYLQNSIHFVATGATARPAESAMLQQLRRAIIDHMVVRFQYHKRYTEDGKSTQREANPYSLVHFFNAWHLVAHCHLRQDIRNFRLDRMENLELLPKTFNRPSDFQVQQQHSEPRSIRAQVLFDHEVARWVRETHSYYMIGEEETSEGLLVTLGMRQESEVMQWLLSWGRHVRVLEPESLRRRLLEEAEKMLRNYQDIE